MFRKILVPLDGSGLAEQALATAATVCARAGGASGGIEILLVDGHPGRIAERGGQGSADQRVYAAAVAEEASRLLGIRVSGTVTAGDPARAIVAHARHEAFDLIVMTTLGHTGLRRAVVGSVADRVVRDAGIPVLLQRPSPQRNWRMAVGSGFQRILVALDGTDDAMPVLATALDLCRWMKARPILARVVLPVIELLISDAGVPSYGALDEEATRNAALRAQDALTELALDIEADSGMRVDTAVAIAGNVGEALAGIASTRDADLIAMVTHARGASRVLVASVTDGVLRGTGLPLLLLHPAPAPVAALIASLREPSLV